MDTSKFEVNFASLESKKNIGKESYNSNVLYTLAYGIGIWETSSCNDCGLVLDQRNKTQETRDRSITLPYLFTTVHITTGLFSFPCEWLPRGLLWILGLLSIYFPCECLLLSGPTVDRPTQRGLFGDYSASSCLVAEGQWWQLPFRLNRPRLIRPTSLLLLTNWNVLNLKLIEQTTN